MGQGHAGRAAESPGSMLIFGVGRRCPGISRHAPRAAGPSRRSRGAGGPRPPVRSPGPLPCALRRRRRCSPRSVWRWRPPQEPQVGTAGRSRARLPPPHRLPLPRRGEGGPGAAAGARGGAAPRRGGRAGQGRTCRGRGGGGGERVGAEGTPRAPPVAESGAGAGGLGSVFVSRSEPLTALVVPAPRPHPAVPSPQRWSLAQPRPPALRCG